jgi:hypothetical protein
MYTMTRKFIFTSLQRYLEAQVNGFKNVSEQLQISEEALKLIFTQQDCSFKVLEHICQIAGVKLEDFFGNLPKEPKLLEFLTSQQEIELISNKKLFAVAVFATYLMSFKEILDKVKVHKVELKMLLERLESMGMVTVLPNNEFKLTISKRFSWIPDGPIMGMIRREALNYFNYSFEDPAVDLINTFNVLITPAAHEELKAKLVQIAKEYRIQMLREASLPAKDKIQVSFCIAARSWLPVSIQSHLRTSANP